MALNRFNIQVFIQILLIAAVGMLFALTIRKDFMQMTSAGLLILWIGQILFLTHYMNKIHRDVAMFMDALRNQDTSRHFAGPAGGKYFRTLYHSFEEINRNFRLVRIEKETENQFFREIIYQSPWGILGFDETGAMRLANTAALKLLSLQRLRNLEELYQLHPGFRKVLQGDLRPNRHELKIMSGGKRMHLAVKSAMVRMHGHQVSVIFLSDVSREMAWNEVEAWQKLIRVLNHEITNSVSPIHILSTSLYELFQRVKVKKSPNAITEKQIDQALLGLKTIAKRSGGLADFIKDFRNFIHTGTPDYTSVKVLDLLQGITTLMSSEIARSGAEVSVEVTPSDLVLLADEKLVEQALMNLLRNALQATADIQKARIGLRGYLEDDQVCLEVSDNGAGIPVDMMEQVFTPFFTTRKEGSGIGLSMARQVMQMHHGSITVGSGEGRRTTFTLAF
jgi:two-component system nitrogen regulation sensor histidine kinase NtrY